MVPSSSLPFLKPRRTTNSVASSVTQAPVCGYKNGNPQDPRTAESGFACRFDPANNVWGFCSTDIVTASDCGLAGRCVDKRSCAHGCGQLNNPSVATTTCNDSEAAFCSTALLTAGPDQTYSYLACAAAAKTENFLAQFTTATDISTPVDSLTATRVITKVQATSSRPATGRPASATLTGGPIVPDVPLAASASASVTPTGISTTGKSLNAGAIAGGVLGGLILLCLVVFSFVVLPRQRLRYGRGRSQVQSVEVQDDYSEVVHSAKDDVFRGGQEKYPGHQVVAVELPSWLQNTPMVPVGNRLGR